MIEGLPAPRETQLLAVVRYAFWDRCAAPASRWEETRIRATSLVKATDNHLRDDWPVRTRPNKG